MCLFLLVINLLQFGFVFIEAIYN